MVKSIALTLVFCLVFQEFSYASPELLPLIQGKKEDLSWAKKILPSIPESVASIEDAYQVPQGSDPSGTVILIQDAHTNSSAQANEAKLLEHLFKNSLAAQTIFLEAGDADDSLSFLRPQASLEKRTQAAKSFLLQGRLQGVEYLDLTSKHKLVLQGVEDMALYFRSVELYREVSKKRDHFQTYLSKIENTVETLRPKVLNPFLLVFDTERRKYFRNQISLKDYLGFLFSHAGKLNSRYEHLHRLQQLQEKESKIDFAKAQEEQGRLVSTLPEAERRELLGASQSTDRKVQDAFFCALEEKMKDPAAYPNLSLYLGYFKESRNIDARAVLAEQKLLENEIADSLIVSEEERQFLDNANLAGLFQKMATLQMTPEEYEECRKKGGVDAFKTVTGFLNKLLMDRRTNYDKALFLEDGYEDVARLCAEFYELTLARDRKMVENMLPKLDPKTPNILITGGYHAPNLKSLLKKQNISYISIAPQILEETNLKRYEEILLKQKAQSFVGAGQPVMTMPLRLVRRPDEMENFISWIGADKTLTAARLSMSSEEDDLVQRFYKAFDEVLGRHNRFVAPEGKKRSGVLDISIGDPDEFETFPFAIESDKNDNPNILRIDKVFLKGLFDPSYLGLPDLPNQAYLRAVVGQIEKDRFRFFPSEYTEEEYDAIIDAWRRSTVRPSLSHSGEMAIGRLHKAMRERERLKKKLASLSGDEQLTLLKKMRRGSRWYVASMKKISQGLSEEVDLSEINGMKSLNLFVELGEMLRDARVGFRNETMRIAMALIRRLEPVLMSIKERSESTTVDAEQKSLSNIYYLAISRLQSLRLSIMFLEEFSPADKFKPLSRALDRIISIAISPPERGHGARLSSQQPPLNALSGASAEPVKGARMANENPLRFFKIFSSLPPWIVPVVALSTILGILLWMMTEIIGMSIEGQELPGKVLWGREDIPAPKIPGPTSPKGARLAHKDQVKGERGKVKGDQNTLSLGARMAVSGNATPPRGRARLRKLRGIGQSATITDKVRVTLLEIDEAGQKVRLEFKQLLRDTDNLVQRWLSLGDKVSVLNRSNQIQLSEILNPKRVRFTFRIPKTVPVSWSKNEPSVARLAGTLHIYPAPVVPAKVKYKAMMDWLLRHLDEEKEIEIVGAESAQHIESIGGLDTFTVVRSQGRILKWAGAKGFIPFKPAAGMTFVVHESGEVAYISKFLLTREHLGYELPDYLLDPDGSFALLSGESFGELYKKIVADMRVIAPRQLLPLVLQDKELGLWTLRMVAADLVDLDRWAERRTNFGITPSELKTLDADPMVDWVHRGDANAFASAATTIESIRRSAMDSLSRLLNALPDDMKTKLAADPNIQKILTPSAARLASAEDARRMALLFEKVDPVMRLRFAKDFAQSEYLFTDGINGIPLSRYPAEPLISDFLSLPYGSREYELTVKAMSFNFSLLFYARARDLYQKMDASQPDKKKDLVSILSRVQHNGLVVATSADAKINRRTWANRADDTFVLIDQKVKNLLDSDPIRTVRVADMAASDGTITLELAQHLAQTFPDAWENGRIQILGSDIVTDFTLAELNPKTYGEGAYAAYDSKGKLIQFIKDGGQFLYVAHFYHQDYFPKGVSRQKLELDFRKGRLLKTKKINLINPEAVEFSQNNPGRFEFKAHDVFDSLPAPKYDFIRVLGLLMRDPKFVRFDLASRRKALAVMGRALNEGGQLLNGAYWKGIEGLEDLPGYEAGGVYDFYERRGETLTLSAAFGYRDTGDVENISLVSEDPPSGVITNHPGLFRWLTAKLRLSRRLTAHQAVVDNNPTPAAARLAVNNDRIYIPVISSAILQQFRKYLSQQIPTDIVQGMHDYRLCLLLSFPLADRPLTPDVVGSLTASDPNVAKLTNYLPLLAHLANAFAPHVLRVSAQRYSNAGYSKGFEDGMKALEDTAIPEFKKNHGGNKPVVVIAGLPGSGKSEFANLIETQGIKGYSKTKVLRVDEYLPPLAHVEEGGTRVSFYLDEDGQEQPDLDKQSYIQFAKHRKFKADYLQALQENDAVVIEGLYAEAMLHTAGVDAENFILVDLVVSNKDRAKFLQNRTAQRGESGAAFFLDYVTGFISISVSRQERTLPDWVVENTPLKPGQALTQIVAPDMKKGIEILDHMVQQKLKFGKDQALYISLFGGGGMGTTSLSNVIAQTGFKGIPPDQVSVIDTDKYIPRFYSDRPGEYTHDFKHFFTIPDGQFMEEFLNFQLFEQDFAEARSKKAVVLTGVFSEYLLKHNGFISDLSVRFFVNDEIRLRRMEVDARDAGDRFERGNAALARLESKVFRESDLVIVNNTDFTLAELMQGRQIQPAEAREPGRSLNEALNENPDFPITGDLKPYHAEYLRKALKDHPEIYIPNSVSTLVVRQAESQWVSMVKWNKSKASRAYLEGNSLVLWIEFSDDPHVFRKNFDRIKKWPTPAEIAAHELAAVMTRQAARLAGGDQNKARSSKTAADLMVESRAISSLSDIDVLLEKANEFLSALKLTREDFMSVVRTLSFKARPLLEKDIQGARSLSDLRSLGVKIRDGNNLRYLTPDHRQGLLDALENARQAKLISGDDLKKIESALQAAREDFMFILRIDSKEAMSLNAFLSDLKDLQDPLHSLWPDYQELYRKASMFLEEMQLFINQYEISQSVTVSQRFQIQLKLRDIVTQIKSHQNLIQNSAAARLASGQKAPATFVGTFGTRSAEILDYLVGNSRLSDLGKIVDFRRLDEKVSERFFAGGTVWRLTDRYEFTYEGEKVRFESTYYDAGERQSQTRDLLLREIRIANLAHEAGVAPAVKMVNGGDDVLMVTKFISAPTADRLKFDAEGIRAIGFLVGTLHQKGIVHNDLTHPDYVEFRHGNILVSQQGPSYQMQVVDFEYAQETGEKRLFMREAHRLIAASQHHVKPGLTPQVVRESFMAGYSQVKAAARLAETPEVLVDAVVVDFLQGVVAEQGRSGRIVVDLTEYEVEESGKELVIRRGGREIHRAKSGWRKISSEADKAGRSEKIYEISMPDLKVLLQNSFDQANHIVLDPALDEVPALIIINLDALNTSKTFNEVTLPLLVREMDYAHRHAYGQKAQFLLEGSSETKHLAAARLAEYFVRGQNFIFTEGNQVASENKAHAAYLTTPQASRLGIRNLYIQTPEEGDIFNLRGWLKIGLGLGRIKELVVTNPQFMQLRQGMELLLGHAIDNLADFIQAINAISSNRNFYALPRLIRIPLNSALQAARMAARMAEQAA